MTKPNEPNEKMTLADEAVEWFVRLDAKNLSEGERRAFEAWRTRSPAHQRAFDEIARLWQTFDRLPEKPRVDAHSPLPLQDESHPEPFGGAFLEPCRRTQDKLLEKSRSRPKRVLPRWAWGGTLAVALSLIITLTTDVLTTLFADYSTHTGEVRTISLADGSTVSLNTDSALDIELSPNTRRVTVLRGEAFFVVAPDPARPFQVVANEGMSTALGTEFSVRRNTKEVIVTVQEGQVAVSTALPDLTPTKATTVTLSRSQQVTYSSADGLGQVAAVDLYAITAWRRGKIIFEARPLGEVIDELNRYHTGHIHIIDPQIWNIRVNGVFEATDPASVIDAVERSLPVRSTRLTNFLILLHR